MVGEYSTFKDLARKRYIKFREKTEPMKTFPVEIAKSYSVWSLKRSTKTNEEESLGCFDCLPPEINVMSMLIFTAGEILALQ